MNFDKNPPQHVPTKKSVSSLLLKFLGAGILIFFLLFMMNKVVKNEVSTLIEQKNISTQTKSLESNRNP